MDVCWMGWLGWIIIFWEKGRQYDPRHSNRLRTPETLGSWSPAWGITSPSTSHSPIRETGTARAARLACDGFPQPRDAGWVVTETRRAPKAEVGVTLTRRVVVVARGSRAHYNVRWSYWGVHARGRQTLLHTCVGVLRPRVLTPMKQTPAVLLRAEIRVSTEGGSSTMVHCHVVCLHVAPTFEKRWLIPVHSNWPIIVDHVYYVTTADSVGDY